MTTKLVQKHLFKGTREFEIDGETVHVRMKSPLGNEEVLTVMLSVLNPEPRISRSLLEFTSRVNNEPLLSLYLAKPNADEFNAFVSALKQRAHDEYNAFAGLKPMRRGPPADMSAEEPPVFDDARGPGKQRIARKVSAESVASSLAMLSTHVGRDGIGAFYEALEALQAQPGSEDALARMIEEFEALGPRQGAVLTYAPYVGLLMSDDPFET